MKKVAIIDYGMGNLDSVARAVEECGGQATVTNEERDLVSASFVILPGVGAFAAGMRAIRARKLDTLLERTVLRDRIPVLGICLGMQLMARRGFEPEETEGLGWIDAEVRLLQSAEPQERVPHVGWNEVVQTRDCPLLASVPTDRDFYFVHSYHVLCNDQADVVARTPYCGGFVSVIHRGHLFGVQFHPEKSQRLGAQVIRNFLEYRAC